MSNSEKTLPEGVEKHGKRIRITFSYQGQRCRETLKEIPKNKFSKTNIKYATRKREAVLHEISVGTFNYSEHFPDSNKAALFSGVSNKSRTVEEGIKAWLAINKIKTAPSTFKNYRLKSKYLIKHWPNRKITDITKSEIEIFQTDLLTQPRNSTPGAARLSPKTVNDIFTVVRGIWGNAFADNIIKQNPLDRICNIDRTPESGADPFTEEEIDKIANTSTQAKQELNMALFNMWVGLSISELIALSWEDIDTVNWIIKIQRARVNYEYKVPKETYRAREVELLEPAIQFLKEQKSYSFMQEVESISVRQRDNITFKEEKVRFVFLKSSNSQPHNSDTTVREIFWRNHLRKAKVRYRGCNQWKHTFASQMLSKFVPQEWIAKQMGHSDTTMLKRHYAKWIPQDTTRMAGLISKMLGFTEDTSSDNEQQSL